MLSILKASLVSWEGINSIGDDPPNSLFKPKDLRPGYKITRGITVENGKSATTRTEINCEVIKSNLAGIPLFKCTTSCGKVVVRYTPEAATREIRAGTITPGQAHKKFGVPKSTLQDRVWGKKLLVASLSFFRFFSEFDFKLANIFRSYFLRNSICQKFTKIN